MACEVLKNISMVEDAWELAEKKGIKKEDFIKKTLCAFGIRDLKKLMEKLEKYMKNAGLLKKYNLSDAEKLIKEALGYAKNKNINEIKKLAKEELVILGVRKLNTDDKKVLTSMADMIGIKIKL